MGAGECFGETSYVLDATRRASIVARDDVTLLRLSSTLLETLSTSCQLRFNRVFLRTLISRLQGGGKAPQ
jgi:CRP-like cAMP-binding protein